MANIIRDINGESIHIGQWEHDFQPVLNPDAENMTLGEARAMEAEGKNPYHLYDENGELVTEDLHPLPEGATQAEEPTVTLPDGGIAAENAYKVRRRSAYGSAEKQLEFIAENGIQAFRDRVASIKQDYPKR